MADQQTLRGLPRRWRSDAEKNGIQADNGAFNPPLTAATLRTEALVLNLCADELESALSAPVNPSGVPPAAIEAAEKAVIKAYYDNASEELMQVRIARAVLEAALPFLGASPVVGSGDYDEMVAALDNIRRLAGEWFQIDNPLERRQDADALFTFLPPLKERQ